jgi:hypothetical protein
MSVDSFCSDGRTIVEEDSHSEEFDRSIQDILDGTPFGNWVPILVDLGYDDAQFLAEIAATSPVYWDEFVAHVSRDVRAGRVTRSMVRSLHQLFLSI